MLKKSKISIPSLQKMYNFEVSEQSLSLQFYENHRSKPHNLGTGIETVETDSIFSSHFSPYVDLNLSRP